MKHSEMSSDAVEIQNHVPKSQGMIFRDKLMANNPNLVLNFFSNHPKSYGNLIMRLAN